VAHHPSKPLSLIDAAFLATALALITVFLWAVLAFMENHERAAIRSCVEACGGRVRSYDGVTCACVMEP